MNKRQFKAALAKIADDYWEDMLEAEDAPYEASEDERINDFILYQALAREIDLSKGEAK